jgi:hypothetical protein
MVEYGVADAPTEPNSSLEETNKTGLCQSFASDKQNLTEDEKAVIAVRSLVFDLTHQNGGGHGGSALGMAAIGVALWKYTMRYNPSKPGWIDRDRFVLSNGIHDESPIPSKIWTMS